MRERARYLRRAAQVLVDHSDEIAELLTREQGKPRVEAYTMEVLPTIDLLHWCADHGQRILADEPIKYTQLMLKQKKSFFSYEPIGVVGVIAPWNYPWSIPFGEVAIALMAGNGVVLKPASLTPLIGQRIQEVFERAGLPEGLVRTVHGGGAVGQALVESTAGKIFFTGSVEVGRKVGEECARRMKGSVLELGGKDPQIVCADANLPNADLRRGLGRIRKRRPDVLGHRARLRDARRRRPVHRRRRARGERAEGRRPARMGHRDRADGLEGAVRPRQRAGRRRDRRRREAALRRPARGATGSAATSSRPTVLTDVTHDMRIMREEIFGPVLPIMTVDTEQEAIDLANDSQFGLGASVWTLDRDKGERIARQIQSGMVWINDHSYSHGACQCSWGGVKDSGLGRSHSKFGFYECTNIKLRLLGAVAHARHLVAPVRRGARQGDPRLGPPPLRPQRPAGPGAARGRAAAAARDAPDAARHVQALAAARLTLVAGKGEIIARLFAAFNEGGVDAAAEFLDPEVAFSEPPEQPGATTFYGRERVLEGFGKWAETWSAQKSVIQKVIENDEQVVVLTLETLVGHDGIAIEQPSRNGLHLQGPKDRSLRFLLGPAQGTGRRRASNRFQSRDRSIDICRLGARRLQPRRVAGSGDRIRNRRWPNSR